MKLSLPASLARVGGTTKLLEELAESGLITPYVPFDRTAKDSIYKLTDEYSLFYVKFIEHTRFKGPGTWQRLSTVASWKSRSGIALESICMKHETALKAALGIGSVHTETPMWRYRQEKDEKCAQIDLLIDRRTIALMFAK